MVSERDISPNELRGIDGLKPLHGFGLAVARSRLGIGKK
jgi:hypothetical protein